MTDYSKMSDQEINQLVGIAISRDKTSIIASDGNAVIHEYSDCGEFKGLCLGWKVFDPCNNPADAWPIITEAKISLLSVDCIDGSSSWLAKSKACPSRGDSNPLRAAMIVFLMMQEK